MSRSSGASAHAAPRVVVVGGGFTGTSVVAQLARAARAPLEITVVEPRASVGPGLAYSADDPDHRLNGSIDSHLLDPMDPAALRRWCERSGALARDPEALAANGAQYIRRRDFGAFLEAGFREAGASGRHAIAHRRDQATGLRREGGGFRVELASGPALAADFVVIATGNGGVRLPPGVDAGLRDHPAFIANALETARLRAIDRDARVLLVGAGLTALDVLSTLVRRGHRGEVTVLSRHGIRPRPQRTPAAPGAPGKVQGLDPGVPDFVAALGPQPRVLALARALRRRIRDAVAQGREWQEAFDELRDAVWVVWPRLAAAEKRRFLRLLRPWYDAHRFRAPPQNVALVEPAERSGQVRFRTGRLESLVAEGEGIRASWRDPSERVRERFDAAVSCVGLDPAFGAAANPFLAALLRDGVLAPDASGLGFAVDAECRPLDARGRPGDGLRIFGPPTAGACGDPLGVLFIAPQVHRALPGMAAELDGLRDAAGRGLIWIKPGV